MGTLSSLLAHGGNLRCAAGIIEEPDWLRTGQHYATFKTRGNHKGERKIR